jgi:hypothetical protein
MRTRPLRSATKALPVSAGATAAAIVVMPAKGELLRQPALLSARKLKAVPSSATRKPE